MAGAKMPKGEVEATLVPDSVSVGAILHAEANASIDGLEIINLVLPEAETTPTDRLELITRTAKSGVTTNFKGRGGEDSDGGRSRRGDSRRSRRRDDADDDGKMRGRKQRFDSSSRSERRLDGRDRRGRGSRAGGSLTDGRQRSDRRSAGSETGRRIRRSHSDSDAPKTYAPRLHAKQNHRNAVIKELPADQHALARELLKGGMPGVRKTLDRMNQRAREENIPEIAAEPIVTLATKMNKKLRAAEWEDRADAALAGIDKIDLRDLRSVVASADAIARTKRAKDLAEQLKSGLTARIESDHQQWLGELESAITDGRSVRALRISSRPPKAGVPLPAPTAERLAQLASADMNADAAPLRWGRVVEALSLSPVRLQVTPDGVPVNPGEELREMVSDVAEQVPHIAKLFGIEPEEVKEGAKSEKVKLIPSPDAVVDDESGGEVEDDGVGEEATDSGDGEGEDDGVGGEVEDLGDGEVVDGVTDAGEGNSESGDFEEGEGVSTA